MLNLRKVPYAILILICGHSFAYGQTLKAEILANIWRLDSSGSLPNRYSLAVRGTKELLDADKGAVSLRCGFVTFADMDKELRLDASITETVNHSLHVQPGTWKSVLNYGKKRDYSLGPMRTANFDFSGELDDDLRRGIANTDLLVYRFDPLVLPIAPQKFSSRYLPSSEMIFLLYENGRIEKVETIGNLTTAEWSTGPKFKGKLRVDFESKADGVMLPVVARWYAPIELTNSERKDDNFVMYYIVKTQWQSLTFGDNLNAWVPKMITSSQRIGTDDSLEVRDYQFEFYWLSKVPAGLEDVWRELDWNEQFKKIVSESHEQS